MSALDSYLRIRVTRTDDDRRRLRNVELCDPMTGEALGSIPVTSVSMHQEAQDPQKYSFEVFGHRVDEVLKDE